MSREISIFANYRQNENTLTNYCGLIMKLLYEESPNLFEEFLSSILSAEGEVLIGPAFTQQSKQKASIPDLSITQKSFSIFFETKLTDWFYKDQINRHIEAFKKTSETNILFLLSNFDADDPEMKYKSSIQKAKNDGIILHPLSIEDFVGSLEEVCRSEYLINMLEEFKIYLDRNDNLPKWKYLLDVVNCSGSLEEVLEGTYICPDTGGAYSHRRAKYFGPYANKEVRYIFEIKAVVSVDLNMENANIKWKNTKDKNEELINEAVEKIRNSSRRADTNKSTPLQVFLLHKRAETEFIKETSGGMFQSKKYFWGIAEDCSNSNELAAKLKGKEWGKFVSMSPKF